MNFEKETEVAASVWNDYNDREYIRDQSHWRGVGRWTDDQAWQAIGKASLQRFNFMHAAINQPPNLGLGNATFLEWGPGGGANLFAFAPFCKYYIGVDIAQLNLDEASRMITQAGFGDKFIPAYLQGSPKDLLTRNLPKAAYFLSTAVFQHFPSKAYGQQVLATLFELCQPLALGFIQIRYDNNNPRYRSNQSLEEYQKRHITATSYAIDEFADLCVESGFSVLAVGEIVSANNYATFYLRKKK
jgi:hypothetical protein